MVVNDPFIQTLENIISSKKQAQLVVAAAGSGKTKLLVEVLTKRIMKGITDPIKDKVIVFTFTNNAADELVVRISAALEVMGRKNFMSQIFIGTIHSWCSNYLKDNGILANTKIVDELEQSQLVQRMYSILQLDALYSGKNQFEKIDKFLADLELFYDESLHVEDSAIPNNVRIAIKGYLAFMKNQRLLDFGSIIRQAIDRLSEANNGNSCLDVYVDEYQDVNPAQVHLLQAMLNGSPKSHLFAVADPRQSIYQWRGSDFSRTISFNEDFSDSQNYEIVTNYRSRTGIVNFANLTAKELHFSKIFSIKDMGVSNNRRDEKVSVILDDTTFPNESGIVDTINMLLAEGVKPGEIAVLMRSVLHHGKALMESFESAKIPYYSPNRNAGTTFVQEYMLSIIDLIELMQNPPIPANRDEESELDERVQQNLARIAKYCKEKDPRKIQAQIAQWHKELTMDKTRPSNERYNFRQQFFDFCEAVRFEIGTGELTIQEGFSAITQIMRAIEEAYRRRFAGAYNIRAAPVEVFTHNLKWQLTNELERWTEVGMTSTRPDAVTICTVHAAKGLEWPVVIVPFAWEGRFPVRGSTHATSFSDDIAGRYGTTVEDERRLWYVAITRARDRLYIYSANDNRQPSRFVHPESFDGKISGTALLSRTSEADFSRVEGYMRPYYLHLGVSDLLLLLECPYHFYLRLAMGVDVPVGKELGAGNIVHRVIQRVVKEGPANLKDLVREEVYLPLGEIEHELRTRKSVESKVKRLISSGFLINIDKTEYRFSFLLDTLVVSGIVDATKPSGHSITLVDWKFSIHNEFRHRYESQLRTYAFGLRNSGIQVVNAILYDLSHGGKLAEVPVDVSKSKTDEVIRIASEIYRNLSNTGPYTTPGILACSACDVSQICPDSLVKGKRSKLSE